MTEPPALPAPALPETEPDLPPPVQPPEPRQGRNVVPWFYAFGFLVLAGAIAYLWMNTPGAYTLSAPGPDLQAMQQQLQGLDTRLSRLEQNPAGGDTAALAARVTALEQRPADNGDTGALAGRLTTLEQRVNAASQMAGRYDALAGRVDALSGKVQSGETDLDNRISALEAQMKNSTAAAEQLSALNERANRISRVQAATAALRSGEKLGDIPGAPPALTRYAAAKPPTEAELRLAFPAVERAALAASRPDIQGKPFLDRAWARAQTLVTVRQGDDVVVGDAASGILARAHTALEAGDLAGAVAILSDLKGVAAQPVASWLDDAKGLLAARAALADMAEQS